MELDLASSSSHTVQPQTHAVFLSFRGSDTRYTFVSHLYTALQRQGIPTFLDSEEFQRGREISKILNEIESSNVSIIIFSKNYADSTWCLDELVQIMKCKETRGQEVVPVFYHVDPSDLESESGSYGVAIADHQKHMDHKANWRTALRQAASLSGWVVGNDRPEAPLIEEIVECILTKLKHLYSSHELERLVGIHDKIQKVEALLHIGRVDIRRVVGIWGMGGVGKTTLARVVFDRCSFQFDGCCFLQNVRERSNIVGVDQLRKDLMLDIFGGNYPSTVMDQRLTHKRVLIVLDDVDNFLLFDGIIWNLCSLGTGSRIIVTSRDKSVLDNVADQGCIYEVPTLRYDEALELFSLRAEKEKFPSSSHLGLAKSFVKYAGGNPLAVAVLGGFLYKKDIEEWKSALLKLEKNPDLGILKVLRISYDGLDKHDKQIFLNIACFLRGRWIDEVKRILDGLGFHTKIGLRNLVNKSLVEMSSLSYGVVVDMHELLEELGKQLVREECEKEPGKRSRLFDPEDVIHVLGKNTGTDSVEAISLRCGLCLSLDPTVFMNMTRLKFLELSGRNKLDLSKGLKYLPKELRYLRWQNYPLKSLPSNFVATALVELDVYRSNIEQCWKGVQDMPNLKIMNLSRCERMIEMPDLSKAPMLEELVCSGCKNLEEVSPSISHLSNPEKLDFSGCWTIKSFPSIDMPNLKIINLSGCRSMIEMPDLSKAPMLEELVCSGCENLEEVSPSVSYLSNLEKLDFSRCSKIRSFPSINMPNLKIMNLSWCSNMIEMSDLSKAPKLKELACIGCKNLEEVSPSISHLSNLEKLDFFFCGKIRSFPSTVSLMCLKELSLTGCWNLILLPEVSRNIKRMDLSNSGIKEIPLDTFRELSFLKDLYLDGCQSLGSLPNSLGFLYSLRKLDVSWSSIESISTSIIQLSQLQELNIRYCERLQCLPKLPPSVCALRADGCRSLQNVSFSPILTPFEVERWNCDCILEFSFINCVELDESTCEKIFAFAQQSITSVVAPALNKWVEKGRKDKMRSRFVVAGNEMPHWIEHRSGGGGGSSITIDFQPSNLLGFIFCAVLDFHHFIHKLSDTTVNFRFEVQLNSNHCGSRCESRSMGVINFFEAKLQHVVLFYAPYVPSEADSQYSELSATMEILSAEGCSWVQWGLSLIHMDGDDEEYRNDKGWPEKVKSTLHEDHELVLSRGARYICDGCNEEGRMWSFYCKECDFDLHPNCALKDNKETKDETKVNKDNKENDGWIGDEEGWPEKVKSTLHEDHELVLSCRVRYICDGCNEEGRIWLFYCEECNFGLHPNCALKDN